MLARMTLIFVYLNSLPQRSYTHCHAKYPTTRLPTTATHVVQDFGKASIVLTSGAMPQVQAAYCTNHCLLMASIQVLKTLGNARAP